MSLNMKSEKCLYLWVLLCLVIVLLMISGTTAAPAKRKAKGRSTDSGGGSGLEFHLSCTVLINGTPGNSAGAAAGASPGAGGGDAPTKPLMRSKKKAKTGRRKRSIRVKRQVGKVQLLCDIENKVGQVVAMRSLRPKAKAKKG